MGAKWETEHYKDVHVTVHREMPSGIITSKVFKIQRNELEIRARLRVMCLKHDLKCRDCSLSWDETTILCCLRSFDDTKSLYEYVKKKAGALGYSIKIKNGFALANIGTSKYVYRLNK